MPVAILDKVRPPKFSLTGDGMTATLVQHIAWGDIDAFIEEHVPATQTFGQEQGQDEVTFPGKDYLVLEGLEIEGLEGEPGADDSNGVPTDQSGIAVCTLKFITRPWHPGPEPTDFLQHAWRTTAEFDTYDGMGLQYWNGSEWLTAASTHGLIKNTPIIEHSFTWRFVPNPPFSAIRANIGKVNSGAFFGAASETLMFNGVDANETVLTDGQRSWTLSYQFLEKVVNGDSLTGWNHNFIPQAGAWKRVRTEDQQPPYALSSDFAALFQSG